MIDNLVLQKVEKGLDDSSYERSSASASGYWVAGVVVFVWQWKSSKGYYWRWMNKSWLWHWWRARTEVSFSWRFLPYSHALPKWIFLCDGYHKLIVFFLTVYCLMTLMAESMHSPFYHQNFCCLVAFVSHSQQLKEIFAFWEFQESINISLLILQPIRIYHCFVKTFHFEIRRKTFRYVKKQFCLIFSLPSCKYFAACSLWK